MTAYRTETHLYCLCWNDSRILPFFFQHYRPFVDRFFVYDNGSTDGSLDLLHGDDRVSVRHFDTPGDSFVAEELRLSETIWRESRGRAAWVIVLDLDEFIHHPDIAAYLRQCWEQGVTAIGTTAYEMIAEAFPPADIPLVQSVTHGFREPTYDKLCVFDPNAIDSTNYTPGRHKASPRGRVVYPASSELLLLHYKKLGLPYLVDRSASLAHGLGDGDLALNFGTQYLMSARRWQGIFWNQRRCAAPLAALTGIGDPDLHVVIGGARFDAIEAADNRHVFCIPPDTAEITVASVPGIAQAGLCNGHPRSVAVSRIRLRADDDFHDLPIEKAAADAGWLDMDRVGPMSARWTDGRATIAIPPKLRHIPQLEVEIVWPTCRPA
ncbi:MAG: glycosyltransferase family 2 protein [Acetobacteraceae bacterium]